ncbi:uncharacterized protein EV420DRAFT_1636594 [Desarmillaria tabescens]|uniref:Uncharacterized protein n=1 Tax=Armillaria tabescens TaxID=1929756 RepID=A0AA39NI27_ARMTA|nr:uncharacterized protein EV420DRAFT_1636594 [Desarmillaria tabescens]KAK0466025.1 hypothetical protein EV420DRAFT_1636594 [Desarmillaria tabescens]
MTSQTNIPEDLTNNEIYYIFQALDTVLNAIILKSLLHGIYTGVLAVTLWTNYVNKSRPIGNVMIMAIILIYTLTSIGFALNWSLVHSAFITVTNRQNFWTVYLKLNDVSDKVVLSMGITGILCTILADSIMIWRCWVIWGWNRLIVLLPTLCLVSSIAFKSFDMYMMFTDRNRPDLFYPVLFASFTLVTMTWCTLGIVYHILSIGGNLRAYRRAIEILVESSTLYSVALILYVALFAHNGWSANYLVSVATVSRGIAPTLIVGRVAAGHARPDDSWQGSVMSSLRFGGNQIPTSSRGSTIASVITDDDLEAQLESEDEHTYTQTCFQRDTVLSVMEDDVLEPEAQPERVANEPWCNGC